MNGEHREIQMAPPKEKPKIFGGSLSIKDFRKDSSKKWNILQPPLIDNNPNIEKNINYSWVKTDDAKQTFDMFDASEVKPNALKVSQKGNEEPMQKTLDESWFFTCNDGE
jgi:hypothetical protein